MTPLAHKLIRDVVLGHDPENAKFRDRIAILMADIHCFDITRVRELVGDLAGTFINDPSTIRDVIDYIFLPAPRTWIEWHEQAGQRCAYHLQTIKGQDIKSTINGISVNDRSLINPEKDYVEVTIIVYDGEMSRCVTIGWVDLVSFKMVSVEYRPSDVKMVGQFVRILQRCYAILSLINTPRIIGRRQYMPHIGLERKLLKDKQLQGKFPLHAWTEITLSCHVPKDLSDAPGYEAHLTGKKCLHFCRAHLRIRNCQVEFVHAHWRGDPSLGIKQSRYKLVPGERKEAS